MKFVVRSEPADQDMYDMTDLSEYEVVEADSEQHALDQMELLGYNYYARRVSDEMPLGYVNKEDIIYADDEDEE